MEKDRANDTPAKKHTWPFAARLTGAIGTVISIATAAILKMKVSEKLNEGISDWANSKWANNFVGGALEGALDPTAIVSEPNDARILRVIDPKQWRSNLVFWCTAVAGMVATIETVKLLFPSVRKMEHEHAEDRKEKRHRKLGLPSEQARAEKSWSQRVLEPSQAGPGIER